MAIRAPDGANNDFSPILLIIDNILHHLFGYKRKVNEINITRFKIVDVSRTEEDGQ